MEEKPGDVQEWGEEPSPGPGGIRGKLGKGRDRRKWLRRW